jgi:hypothetical protein
MIIRAERLANQRLSQPEKKMTTTNKFPLVGQHSASIGRETVPRLSLTVQLKTSVMTALYLRTNIETPRDAKEEKN